MHTDGIIHATLPLHILAGGLALVFGYAASAAKKGATLHRKSGMLIVCAMVTMALTGAVVATLNGSGISVVAGLLTLYWLWRLRTKGTLSSLAVRQRFEPSFEINPKGQAS